MIDDQEIRAVQFLGERVRKATPGCGVWDEPGFTACLAKLRHWNLHLLIEHVIRHAADPKAKTPGVLLGAFTPAAPTAGPKRFDPPKRQDECPRHPGQWANNCGGCRADELAGDQPPPGPRRREIVPPPKDFRQLVDAARPTKEER